MKIRPVEAEFHAGGRTDRQTYMTNLIVAFRNFANAIKTCNSYLTENSGSPSKDVLVNAVYSVDHYKHTTNCGQTAGFLHVTAAADIRSTDTWCFV
jgi:hypothetical protein